METAARLRGEEQQADELLKELEAKEAAARDSAVEEQRMLGAVRGELESAEERNRRASSASEDALDAIASARRVLEEAQARADSCPEKVEKARLAVRSAEETVSVLEAALVAARKQMAEQEEALRDLTAEYEKAKALHGRARASAGK